MEFVPKNSWLIPMSSAVLFSITKNYFLLLLLPLLAIIDFLMRIRALLIICIQYEIYCGWVI
jgi:hypothetical protein